MTAEFSIRMPVERPALRVVQTQAPLAALGTIAVENITEWWNAGPSNRELALRAADENLAASRSTRK